MAHICIYKLEHTTKYTCIVYIFLSHFSPYYAGNLPVHDLGDSLIFSIPSSRLVLDADAPPMAMAPLSRSPFCLDWDMSPALTPTADGCTVGLF